MSPDVIIIGGGLAGLSAGVKLIKNGANVLLVERNHYLGGRTYSFIDKFTNDVVDNGQHLLIGAYEKTFEYLELIGTKDLIIRKKNPQLTFIEKKSVSTNFKLYDFPVPFNITFAILFLNSIPLLDKINILKMGFHLSKMNTILYDELANLTVEEWLNIYNQSEKTKNYFWYPLVISTMNESPKRASALVFARVLKNTYLNDKKNYQIWFPVVGQSELYVNKAIEYFKKNKSNILTGCRVKNLLIENEKVCGIDANKKVYSKYVISAVPHFNFMNIIPEEYQNKLSFLSCYKLSYSPIVSVNMWFDKEIIKEEFIGLIGTNVQWVFNKNKIFNKIESHFSYNTAVISNAWSIVHMPKNQILEIVLMEMNENIPDFGKQNLIHWSVIKEKRATISLTPECEKNRPKQETQFKNFFIAGDWTDTDLPATIEGAIRSGFLCAELISKNR